MSKLRANAASALLAVLALCAGPAWSATYYVDATSGSDANPGTSQAAPWRNAPGMAAYSGAATLSPGDVVYFNSAGVWSVSGTQGLYLAGGVTYIGNGWGSGTRATLRASADLASAVVRFRDHATLPTIIKGFDIDANGKVANGIEMNHSFYAGPLTGATKRVDDVIVHNVWSRASLGQYRYGIIVSNFGGVNAEVANVEILNSVVHDISRDGIPIYPGDVSADCIVRNVVVRNNRVYNTGQDPDYGAGAGIIVKGRAIDATIEHNYVSATKGAGIFVNGNETNHFGYGPTNLHIRYNIVNVNTSHGSIRIYDGAGSGDPKDVRIYGNVVYNNFSNGGLLIESDVKNANTLRVYNNTFFNAPVLINNTAATFPVFEFRNNLVYQSSGTPFTDTQNRVTAHGNNLYAGGGSTLVRAGGTSYGSATLTNYEATALSGDPGFLDPTRLPTSFVGTYGSTLAPNLAGLSLAANSRAIDKGAALSSPYNGSVNSMTRPSGAAFDIGAYEAGGSAAPPLAAPTNLRFVQ